MHARAIVSWFKYTSTCHVTDWLQLPLAGKALYARLHGEGSGYIALAARRPDAGRKPSRMYVYLPIYVGTCYVVSPWSVGWKRGLTPWVKHVPEGNVLGRVTEG